MKINTETAQLFSQTHTAYGWSEGIGMYALAAIYNAFAAADVRCQGTEADIGIPADISRPEIPTAGCIVHGIEKALRNTCTKQGIELVSLRFTRNPLLLVPSVTITGIGCSAQKSGQVGEETYIQGQQKAGRKGFEIVLTKWAGMEGMLRIAGEKEDELRQRFAPVFMRQIHSYEKELFAGRELEIARDAGVTVIRQITAGGLLAGLWELSKETESGLELDMKRMSVLQETIEVCEHYRLNPYQLTSAGSFLMLTEDGRKLVDRMRENQIQASVIGRLTPGKDKVIHNGGDVRYLDRPVPDEIYKLFLRN